MKRITNMFKSKATKEREKREEEEAENYRRVSRENREYWKKSQAASDIKTLEKAGNYTPETINTYRNPEKWSDLNDLASMIRRSEVDRKSVEKERQTEAMFKNIQKQNIEHQQKVNASKTYLQNLGELNTYTARNWSDSEFLYQADIAFRLRKLKNIPVEIEESKKQEEYKKYIP